MRGDPGDEMSLLLQPDEHERHLQRYGAGGNVAVRVGTPKRSLHHRLGAAHASDSEPRTGSLLACRPLFPAATAWGNRLRRAPAPLSPCAGGGVVKLERHG